MLFSVGFIPVLGSAAARFFRPLRERRGAAYPKLGPLGQNVAHLAECDVGKGHPPLDASVCRMVNAEWLDLPRCQP